MSYRSATILSSDYSKQADRYCSNVSSYVGQMDKQVPTECLNGMVAIFLEYVGTSILIENENSETINEALDYVVTNNIK